MIAAYEEVLGCRISGHRSTLGASGMCRCGVHALLAARVLSHRSDRIQIRSARAGLGVVCVANLGDS